MAAVANHQQHPLPARNSPVDHHTDPSAGPHPPAPSASSAPPKGKKNKKGANSNDPNDAHKALLSKISQLEATSTEKEHEQNEIEAEVRKANRDLNQLLNTLEPHNSKLDVVQRKYHELLSDMKKVEREHVKAKKRGDQLQKDKEEIGKERTKERGLKEKLEKLSRELTRENKKLKEDLRDLKESSADRNDELHQKLEGLVMDVEQVVSSDRRTPERPAAELEQDKMFREKFTSFLHQYELRELQFQSVMRTKDLEIAYHMARHDQLKKAQENELSKSHQLTRQFKQVEDTLNNSNDLFLTFRKEMEEMSKKTKRLEKENLTLTRKQEATNKNIFQMAEERTHNQQALDKLTRENEKLKKLCRAMQTGGYGSAGGAAAGDVDAGAEYDDGLEGETESEYDEDDDEYDEDEGEYDDETDEEGIEGQPRVFGPPPPPPPQAEPNGKAKAPMVNGVPAQVNGTTGRHS